MPTTLSWERQPSDADGTLIRPDTRFLQVCLARQTLGQGCAWLCLAVSPRRGLAGQTDNSWVKVEKLSVPWAGPCLPPPGLLHSTEILPTVSVSGAAGGQPWDMPTHGSLAAARQANARARPRARVSGPAHRPRPAQPSAPAPARDTALTPQSPVSYPHTSSTMYLGTGIFLCRSHPQQRPGIFANVSVALFLAWPPKVLQALVSAALLPSVLLGSRWQGRLPAPILVALPISLGCLSSSLLLPRGSLWVFARLALLLTQVQALLPPTPGTPS